MIFVSFLRHAGNMEKYFNAFRHPILRHIFNQIHEPSMRAKRARVFFIFKSVKMVAVIVVHVDTVVLVTLFGQKTILLEAEWTTSQIQERKHFALDDRPSRFNNP